jgi:DNA-binding MarR family transcriptional regulator
MADDMKLKGLRKVDRLLATFRASIGEVIPIQIAHTFVVVAMNEGMSVVDLVEKIGTNKSTLSRHLLDLSDTLRTGQAGYGLLVRTHDPSNLRSVLYTLSPKGKLLRDNLLGVLED